MATKSFDFSTAEGRQSIWEDLSALELSNRRKIRIAKIKNIPVALVYVLNLVLYTAYLNITAMATDGIEILWMCDLPVLESFVALASGYTGDGFWKIMLFGVVFLALVPMILGGVLSIVLSLVIRKEKTPAEKLPEKESDQFNAILDKHKRVRETANSYQPPYGLMFGMSLLASIAFLVVCVMEYIKAEYPLNIGAWVAMILAVVGLGILYMALAFGAMFGLTITSDSKTDEKWEKYCEEVKKAKVKQQQEEEKTRKRLEEEAQQRRLQEQKQKKQELFDRAVQCVAEKKHAQARELLKPLVGEEIPDAMAVDALAWFLGDCSEGEYPLILAQLEHVLEMEISPELRNHCSEAVARLRELCEPAARELLEQAMDLAYRNQHTKALPLLEKAAALGSAEALVRYVDIKYRMENGIIPLEQMLNQELPRYVSMLRRAKNWGFDNVDSTEIYRSRMPHFLTRLGAGFLLKDRTEEGNRLLQEAAEMGSKEAWDLLHPPAPQKTERKVCFYNNCGLCTKKSTTSVLIHCPPDGWCTSYRRG